MRIKTFVCEGCGAKYEEIFTTSEEIPLEISCAECGKSMKITWDLKNNPHKWHYMDALN